MSAVAEAPSQNGDGPKLDSGAYRDAVRAKMKKPAPSGVGFLPPAEVEVSQFLAECGTLYKLEPLAGQIYAVWENGVMRAVTTIDGLRVLAERTGRYDGQSDPEWCDKEGTWTDYWPGGEKQPLAARVRVHKKGTKVATTGTANWCDFAPENTDSGPGAKWSTTGGMPAHLLSIRAEAVALRKAFPSELSGLYTAEELGLSLAAITGGAAEGTSAPAAAIDVPPAPTPPGSTGSVPPAPAAGPADGPAVIVDPPDEQPSGPPAHPRVQRTLAEALAGSECERLRGDLTKILFDQLPDRLTDEQSQVLAGVLEEASAAAITPVELERMCKVTLREGEVEARARAFRMWISERKLKADESAAAGEVSTATTAETPQTEQPPDSPPPEPEPSQSPSLLDADPRPEELN